MENSGYTKDIIEAVVAECDGDITAAQNLLQQGMDALKAIFQNFPVPN